MDYAILKILYYFKITFIYHYIYVEKLESNNIQINGK